MFPSLKSTASRTVHHFHEEDDDQKNKKLVEINHELASSTSLTVWTKSLVFSCSGFTVIDSDGSLAYRVDNYTCRPDQILLMDGEGNPIFTISRRKKLGLMDNNWFVYEGEVGKYSCSNNVTNDMRSTSASKSKKPIFCVRKKVNIFMLQTKLNVLAYVYYGMQSASDHKRSYTVEGSYTRRSCKILEYDTRKVVGEIKKKEAMLGSAGVSNFGLEVFHLVVRPGFDSRFGMAIVLLLDQMFS